jgi:crotonobetainyl-CoA:carnitine CoA-transferase CaiB-like acyl-CoA transferase
MEQKPLSGVRVLEMARVLAGPWCGQILADLGAEVIKIERPEVGDDTRLWGPPYVTDAKGEAWGAAYFHATNRGKKSVCVDFKTSQGQAVLKALASEADVLIENYKVGDLQRYGLDYESVKSVNPRLIYASITGFGQDGPYAKRAGYDFILQGMSGLMDITGEPDGQPQKVGVAVVDLFTGVYTSTAILAALYRRTSTGTGAYIDMALYDVATATLANQGMNYLASGKSPKRLGNAHPNIAPYQVFRVLDGYIIVAVGNDRQFQDLCLVLGADQCAQAPEFQTNTLRVQSRARLTEVLSPYFLHWTRSELLHALEEKAVPAGPIHTVEDVFADPQIIHRAMCRELVGDDGAVVKTIASPIVIDGVRQSSDQASPKLGSSKAEFTNHNPDNFTKDTR